jgi:hypothetical protein
MHSEDSLVLCVVVHVNGVRLVSELWPPADIVFIPQVIISMESHSGIILTGKPYYSREKPVPVPLYPPQIPHRLTWARTWASAVEGRQLTASAMARPSFVK